MKNNSLFDLIKTIDLGFYFFVGKKGASANYVTVQNVVESLYLAATNKKAINKIYKISAWSSIEDFVGIISKHLIKPGPKYRIPLSPILYFAKATSFVPGNPLTISRIMSLCSRSKYSVKKIENELNYSPHNTIDDGLKELVLEFQLRKSL
jgi:nucleoside-diphosphate-sugar epimerase